MASAAERPLTVVVVARRDPARAAAARRGVVAILLAAVGDRVEPAGVIVTDVAPTPHEARLPPCRP